VPQHPEHPQFGLKKLLDALGVRREEVLPLPGPTPAAPLNARAALMGEEDPLTSVDSRLFVGL